uniref:Coatomer subunit zeta n=1 Tax=Romanomermis culicivorax TaxID=13658 RepID=A0A915INZ1_ROMCU
MYLILFQDQSLYNIKGIAILDNDGNRIVAKYYDETYPTIKEQKAFEKKLFNKTQKANSEIILLDGVVCVYRSNVDLFFYVLGCTLGNELILVNVLQCLYDTVSQILRKNVERKNLFDNLDVVLLALDEICDSGIVLETDAAAVVQRVNFRPDEYLFSDQSMSQVGSQLLQSAKDQLKWSLLK